MHKYIVANYHTEIFIFDFQVNLAYKAKRRFTLENVSAVAWFMITWMKYVFLHVTLEQTCLPSLKKDYITVTFVGPF